VGKDVMARSIHASSPRRDGPLVRVNCGAVPELLVEDELFGHEKGAFTGADRRRAGLFEAAHGGTLFIDEIGELAPAAQVKLLHVLENRMVRRIGGTTDVPVDVRVVCATHRDLRAEVQAGRFRSDLFFRVSAFTIAIPPLRERPREILALAHAFADGLARSSGLPRPRLAPDFEQTLTAYAWPGNARELRNAVEHAMVLAAGATLTAECLPAELRDAPAGVTGVREELAHLERARIEQALAEEGGNQTRAAARLGMPRRTLVHKLAKWRRDE
jgi:DNA-binding NtrC family response regulator